MGVGDDETSHSLAKDLIELDYGDHSGFDNIL